MGTAHVGAQVDGETGSSPQVTIEANGVLDVFVVHPCAEDREPIDDCAVRLRDGEIRISSVLSLGPDPNDACGGDVVTECSSPSLPAGSYPVVFGPSEGSLDVPSTFAAFSLEGEERP